MTRKTRELGYSEGLSFLTVGILTVIAASTIWHSDAFQSGGASIAGFGVLCLAFVVFRNRRRNRAN